MNHTISIHNPETVWVSVDPRATYDVLRIVIQSGREYTEISLFGGRWRVAPQTIRVMTDEEAAADDHDEALANEPYELEHDEPMHAVLGERRGRP